MTGIDGHATARKRADARRNERVVLDAAAQAFAADGVDVPVRRIAERAGVGMGTVYRHFPTRADLVVAVYRHQVETCADAGPELLGSASSPGAALARWLDMFVEFLVTKHGLAEAMQRDDEGHAALHAYFVDRLVPVCDQLLTAARSSGEVTADIGAYALMRGIGNLCAGAGADPRYDPTELVALLGRGLTRPAPGPHA